MPSEKEKEHKRYLKLKRLAHAHPRLTAEWHAKGGTGYPPKKFYAKHGITASKKHKIHRHKKVHRK